MLENQIKVVNFYERGLMKFLRILLSKISRSNLFVNLGGGMNQPVVTEYLCG